MKTQRYKVNPLRLMLFLIFVSKKCILINRTVDRQ